MVAPECLNVHIATLQEKWKGDIKHSLYFDLDQLCLLLT